MVHNIFKTLHGITLRPIKLSDAEFVMELRNGSRSNGNIGDTPPSINQQELWLQSYFDRLNDYYFVIEQRDGKQLGTIAIYDIKNNEGEWGRWVLLPDSPAAPFLSAVMVHDIAFNHLGLKSLIGSVVSTNRKVINFHRRFGAEFTHVEPRAKTIGGNYVDLVWIRIRKENWPTIQGNLQTLIANAGRIQSMQEIK
jgi:RimJ/RimL family protein N-acetyltransferase